jgi:uncharacterized protein YgiM (DUF1202 family)
MITVSKKIITCFLMASLLFGCTLANGATSQIPHATAQPAQSPTPETVTCTVTAFEALNLRSAPGTSAAVITTLAHGDLLTILPEPAQDNWIYVRAGDHQGWINQTYCKRSNSNE